MGQDQSQVQGFKDNILKEHEEFKNIYYQNFGDKKVLQLEDILNFFEKRDLFAQKFYQWMCLLSYRKTANRESFIYACEIFLLDSKMIIKESYQNHSFDFFEIFAQLVFTQKLRHIKKFDENSCNQFIDVLFDLMFGNEARSDLKLAFKKSVLNKIDLSQQFLLQEFLQIIKKILPTGIYFLKIHLEKLIKNKDGIQLPVIENPSILDYQTLFLIGLTNSKILNQKKIQCIFDLQKSGRSFYNLASCLTGYSSQLILLIENEYQTTEGMKKDVFGIYTNCIWQDSIVYFGNNENYLFRILQSFDVFYPTFNQRNFIYLNTKEVNNKNFKVGMSFGGDLQQSRVWIDQDIFKKSYVNEDNDKTYQNGLITDSYYENLHITNIQVWSFPNEKTLQIQSEYKKLQENIRRSSTAYEGLTIEQNYDYDLLKKEVEKNAKRSSLCV